MNHSFLREEELVAIARFSTCLFFVVPQARARGRKSNSSAPFLSLLSVSSGKKGLIGSARSRCFLSEGYREIAAGHRVPLLVTRGALALKLYYLHKMRARSEIVSGRRKRRSLRTAKFAFDVTVSHDRAQRSKIQQPPYYLLFFSVVFSSKLFSSINNVFLLRHVNSSFLFYLFVVRCYLLHNYADSSLDARVDFSIRRYADVSDRIASRA